MRGGWLGLVATLTLAVQATGEPAVQQALALRGGAMLLPLAFDADRSPPSRYTLLWATDAGTRRATGEVVWAGPRSTLERHWAADPQPIEFATARTPWARQPWLLMDVPIDGKGDVRIGEHTVQLHWSDLPDAMPDLRLDTSTPLGPAPALVPGMDTPGIALSERWRWELLCAARGLQAPALPEDALQRRLVLHAVGRWRVLMHAAATLDRGLARSMLEALTVRAQHEGVSIAIWETLQSRLVALLAMPLDGGSTFIPSVMQWVGGATEVTAWVQAPLQRFAMLVVANAGTSSRLVEWAIARNGEVPLAVQVPPREVRSETFERPEASSALALIAGPVQAAMALPATRVAPEPPGLQIGPFHSMLTLHDAQRLKPPPPPPPGMRTWAQVRRLLGKWEVLVECHGPHAVPGAPPPSWRVADLKGTEAILVHIAYGGQQVAVAANEAGWVCSAGAHNPVDVRTERHEAGWTCRIILPAEWTATGFEMAMARTHGGADAVETAFAPATPWTTLPGMTAVDTIAWDQGITASQGD